MQRPWYKNASLAEAAGNSGPVYNGVDISANTGNAYLSISRVSAILSLLCYLLAISAQSQHCHLAISVPTITDGRTTCSCPLAPCSAQPRRALSSQAVRKAGVLKAVIAADLGINVSCSPMFIASCSAFGVPRRTSAQMGPCSLSWSTEPWPLILATVSASHRCDCSSPLSPALMGWSQPSPVWASMHPLHANPA